MVCLTLSFVDRAVLAAEASFAPRELFRIPFGKSREALGARIESGNFLFPRDFTMDGAGHFYIYDSNNHRIARYSSDGKYEVGLAYPATAKQIFAHSDSRLNLWLLISDPIRGMYYGIYDAHGQRLKEAIFSHFNQFRLHLDDDATLHVILSSVNETAVMQTYILDEESLLMKREKIAPPPENHHQVRKSDQVYFIDRVPDGSNDDSRHVNRVTDASHRGVANIKGSVIYVTERGDIYTRMGERVIAVYDVDGTLKGQVRLSGLPSACESIRFDSEGNIYQLDGIPDQAGHYNAEMVGMRVIRWERH